MSRLSAADILSAVAQEALEKTMVRRLERFRKTGVITSELKMPLH